MPHINHTKTQHTTTHKQNTYPIQYKLIANAMTREHKHKRRHNPTHKQTKQTNTQHNKQRHPGQSKTTTNTTPQTNNTTSNKQTIAKQTRRNTL